VSEKFRGLEEITIRNLGVIESASVQLAPGLNVLTGETGAGKTMVLTALSLILGGKSDAEKVRTGSDRMVVSGSFLIPDDLVAEVEEAGADVEANSLLITRTVSSDGKSRIQMGGTPVTAGKVGELAERLVEVHAQSTTNRVTKPAFIRDAIDSFGGHHELLSRYVELYETYLELESRIQKLKRDQKNRVSEIERISEFMKAFTAINPELGEIDAIELELTRLNSVDELQQAVSLALNTLDADDYSVTTALVNSKRALDHVSGKDSELDALTQELGDSLYNYQETLGGLHRYLSALDADPSRLEYLQERKSAINALIKKFGEGSDRGIAFENLIIRAQESASRIADLEGGDDRIHSLEVELAKLFKKLCETALTLSSARLGTSQVMQEKITSEVHSLAMPHSSILVDVKSKVPATISDLTAHGADDVQLLFTSHEGASPGVITKVASGGELSRVMLAIEVVLASVNQVNTYVFDEVDSGVGGKAAVEVGRRLKALAQDAQVIVVTHLAQVAVWADHHLVVRKNESGQVSVSDVLVLSEEERSVEIARMLSGREDSRTAQEHAKELLGMVKEA
jgi:DNA repair protein RecN (Recombination protein N)